MTVKFKRKEGTGVGANICLTDERGDYIGILTFHNGQDWQVTNSSCRPEIGWKPFKEALASARREYPNG